MPNAHATPTPSQANLTAMAKLSATAAQESKPTPPASHIRSYDAAKLGHEQLTALLGRDAALQIPALSSTSVGSASSPAASLSAPADAGRAVYSTIPAAFWADHASDPASDPSASADAVGVSRPVQRSVLSAAAHE